MVDPDTRYRRPGVNSGVIIGAVVMGLGVILLLDRMEILDAHDIFRFFWPAVLIGAGLLKIQQCRNSRGRTFGGVLILLGSLLALNQLGYAQLRMGRLWPLFIIGVGALLVWRALEGEPRPARFGRRISPARLNQWAVFGGGEFSSNTKEFEGGEVVAVFGGYKIDLRGADIAGEEAFVNATAMFGGVELRVPDSWNVLMQGLPVLGGFVDNTKHPRESDSAKRLIVQGLAMFGGVEVRN